jgi:hypothetical protein
MSNNNRNEIFYFDSDVLITAKNHYYDPSYAGIFWSWLLAGVEAGVFRTAINVKHELLDGDKDDFLRLIALDNNFVDFWCDTEIKGIGDEFAKLQKWANTQWAAGKRTKKTDAQLSVALSTFAAGKIADPWLVALASHMQSLKRIKAYIVTNETSAPQATSKIKLPDAAKSQNIEVIRLFDLLRRCSGNNFEFMGVT